MSVFKARKYHGCLCLVAVIVVISGALALSAAETAVQHEEQMRAQAQAQMAKPLDAGSPNIKDLDTFSFYPTILAADKVTFVEFYVNNCR